MRIRTCLLALTLTAPIAASGQQRPLQLEDYYRVRDVSAPEISPNGRWVAFTVSTRVEATNGTDTEVWLVPTDASMPARRISAAGVIANSPTWTEDSRLRFSVGRRQLAIDPASPERVDTLAADSTRGRATPLVSPDGKWIAAVRDMPVAKRTRKPQSDFERRAEDHFRGVQFDYLPFAGDGRQFPLPNRIDPEVNPPQEIVVMAKDQPTGDLKGVRLGGALGLRPTSLDWSPDATRIAFTADSNYRSERKYARAELWSVGVADGGLKRLTPNPMYDYSGAQYSADGKWVLTTRGLAEDYILARKLNHGGATDIVLVSADGSGKDVNLTAAWDYLPTQPFFDPACKYVYFGGGIGGTTHLFRVPVSGGPVEQVTRGERRLAGFSYDKERKTMAFLTSVMERPTEISVASIEGSGERQLTHIHDELTRDIKLSRVEKVQFRSKDGTPIEGWLWFPANYDSTDTTVRHPFIVSSHGGPHSADGYAFNFKNHYLAANGYFVLVTNFRSSTGYGEKFLWGTWGGWGNKDGEDVMAGVDYVIAKHRVDPRRVAAMGHSYGGFMTNWLITQYPTRFAAAASGAGIVNWMSDYGNADIPITKEKEFWGAPWDAKARATMLKQSPLIYADRVKAATLFVVGEVDQRVPYSETQQMYVALKKNGVPSKVIRYAGMPHSISGHWNQVHRMMNEKAWIDEHVVRSPQP